MRRARHKTGSVVFDKRRKTWSFLWCVDGHRKTRLIGTKAEYATKTAAKIAAESIRTELMMESATPVTITPTVPTVKALAERYELERIPARFSTARMYRSWLRNHIVPKWGEMPITAVQPRDVELWLNGLDLSPKSRAHIRGMFRILFDFAEWAFSVKLARNPIKLVVVHGATKRTRKPRSLNMGEFREFAAHLEGVPRIMVYVQMCLGLRVSELLALKWSDVDWLKGEIAIQRAVVMQNVGDVKTEASQKPLPLSDELRELLQQWKRTTDFSSESDWIFASPYQIGRLPYSYPWFLREIQKAATDAGIGTFGTHTHRHTYRSWLDAEGTKIAVQQKLMRHADIGTSMNGYGDVVTNEMAEANAMVSRLVFNSGQLIAEVIAS